MTDGESAAEAASPFPASSVLLTFLLTDIRGFTRYSEEHGDRAASRASEYFLALCRETVSAHAGEVFGSAGDQALAAFPSAHAALHAALDIQTRLTLEQGVHPEWPLAAGIGLDTGEGIRVGTDYRSNAINRAARLCSVAGPGEILVSDTVIAVAHAVEGIALVDRGAVLLKGLQRPVQVFQLFSEGSVPGEIPPLQLTLATHPTNLPDAPTPFVGRLTELNDLMQLLGAPSVRLVTLTGPGGIGKTRLAMEAGGRLLHAFRDGVYFCDLSSVNDAALVLSQVADTLGVPEVTGKSLADSLSEYLQAKQLLLVLDNCEQVRAAAPQLGFLLDRSRDLRVLATSRISLHLAREHQYSVRALSTPDPNWLPPVDQLTQYDAVALFVERASAAKRGFKLTNKNANAVAAICRRLDGLPLALELAAARLKLFPPQALLRRLDHALGVLTTGAVDRPMRQRTLRAALDWSYSLLTEPEQMLCARLAVFRGGWTFEAAEVVCNPGGELDLLDGLAALVDWGLVHQEGDDDARFQMLDTIREYAEEQLSTRGEEEQVRSAHARYMTELAEEAAPELRGSRQRIWLVRLEQEHENLRSALRWSAAAGSELAPRLAVALSRFWEIRGHWTEGRTWLEAALRPERGAVHDLALRASALNATGNLAVKQAAYEQARAAFEEALRLRRELGDRGGVAASLNNLGNVESELGRYEQAHGLYEESLRLHRELLDEAGTAQALSNLGTVALCQEKYDRARELLDQGLLLYRKLKHTEGIGASLGNLGWLALVQGRYREAQGLFDESLRLSRALGDQWGTTLALNNLGTVACFDEDYERAQGVLKESLRLSRKLGYTPVIIETLVGLSAVASSQLDYRTAVRLLGAAHALWMSTGGVPEPGVKKLIEYVSSGSRPALGEEGYIEAWQVGQALSLEEAAAIALGESE